MANYYVSSVKFATFTAWSAAEAVTVGTIRRRTNLTTPRVYRCETAGTTGGSEPSWSTTPNSTTNDNGVVWRCITGVSSYGWDSCLGSLNLMGGVVNWQMFDTVFIANDHVEVDATLSALGAVYVSVNPAGSVPPVKADYLRGAKFSRTTGTLTIPKGMWIGIDFVFDHVSASGTINCEGSNNGLVLKDCLLYLKTPNSGSYFECSSTLGGSVEWTQGTKVRFGGHAGQKIRTTNVSLNWNNSEDSDTVSSDGAMPAGLFDMSSYNGTAIKCRGLNLTGFSGTRFVTNSDGRSMLFENCLLNDSVTSFVNGNADVFGVEGANLRFVDCSYVSTPVKQGMISFEAANRRVTTMECVLSDSPDFGAGKMAEQIYLVSSSVAIPAHGLVLKKWNDTVSSLTATIRGVFFGATIPGKSNFSLDLSYPSDTANSFMTGVYDPSDILDTGALASDTSDWTGSVTARGNSTAYSPGMFCKVASNPGKVFIVESGTGNSAASEPAGFATATPGSTVSDGSVTWRCGIGFKLQAAFTPARAGFVRGQAVLLMAASTNVSVVLNPKLEIA